MMLTFEPFDGRSFNDVEILDRDNSNQVVGFIRSKHTMLTGIHSLMPSIRDRMADATSASIFAMGPRNRRTPQKATILLNERFRGNLPEWPLSLTAYGPFSHVAVHKGASTGGGVLSVFDPRCPRLVVFLALFLNAAQGQTFEGRNEITPCAPSILRSDCLTYHDRIWIDFVALRPRVARGLQQVDINPLPLCEPLIPFQ